MDVQTIFYSLGIAFMVLCILILLGIAISVFLIGRKIVKLQNLIEARINDFADFTANPMRKATDIAQNLLSGSSKGSKRKRDK